MRPLEIRTKAEKPNCNACCVLRAAVRCEKRNCWRFPQRFRTVEFASVPCGARAFSREVARAVPESAPHGLASLPRGEWTSPGPAYPRPTVKYSPSPHPLSLLHLRGFSSFALSGRRSDSVLQTDLCHGFGP